jgi:hypothetical protein
MSVLEKFGRVVLLGSWACGGCIFHSAERPTERPRVVVAAGGAPITSAELDELTRAFADRYVGLLYSACDALKKDNPDVVQRREAQVLLLDGSSNVYDIATNADAFTRLLDLVVVTRLMSQVWVDDGRAAQVFGDRAAPLTSAMVHARTESQALAARVLTAEQLGVLESLIQDWRRENPEMARASFVRFSNFAIGRGQSAASEVLAARGFFPEVGEAGHAVDEARLLGERVFYQMKREPTLLQWQIAAAKDDLLATPEIATSLADVHRLTDQVEQLPAHLAAEREAILAAVDSRMAVADATFANLDKVIAESKSLVASMEPASKSLDQMLQTATGLFSRFDEWDRWTVAHESRQFDIREYTELVQQSAETAKRVSELLESSNALLASHEWGVRIDEWNRSADGRIDAAAGKTQLLLDQFFRRLYVAIGVLFVALVCYRVISAAVSRKFADQRQPRTDPPSTPALGNSGSIARRSENDNRVS